MELIIALFVVTIVLTIFTVFMVKNSEEDLNKLEKLLEERKKQEGTSVEGEKMLEQELPIMGETNLTINLKKGNN